MQVGAIDRFDTGITYAEQETKLSKTESRFLSLFFKSMAFYTLLAITFTVLQMGNQLSFNSMMWALISNASVGAAVGMLFALSHDVIGHGRLDE